MDLKSLARVRLQPLRIVDETGKDDDAQHEKERRAERASLALARKVCTSIFRPLEWRVSLKRRRMRIMEKKVENIRVGELRGGGQRLQNEVE